MIKLIYKLLKIIFNVTIKMVLIVLVFNYIILPCVDNWADDVPTEYNSTECVESYEESMELFPPNDCETCMYLNNLPECVCE